MRKKRSILVVGLCIVFVVFLVVYLGSSADDEESPSFEIIRVYSLPISENEEVCVRRVIVSDLTGDGRNEVLISYDIASRVEQRIEGKTVVSVSYEEARTLILQSDAAGNLQKLWEYNAGLTRQTVAIGDFGGHGKVDIVVGGFELENQEEPTSSAISRVEVLRQEDGGFVEVFSSHISGLFGPGDIVTGDFDGDGKTDFIVGGLALEDESPYQAYLFRNDDGEGFTMSPIAVSEMVILGDMWKADVDNDGSLDLMITALDRVSETRSMIVLLNDGRGEFESRVIDVSPSLMVIEDFAGDGYPDIFYTQETQTRCEGYLLRNQQGEYGQPTLIIVGKERWFSAIVTGDFNSDGTPDLILLESRVEFSEDIGGFEASLMGHLLLIEVNEEGELFSEHAWSHRFIEGMDISSGQARAVADISGNGRNDLILISQDGGIYLALNQHG